ncbi:MAG: hypothetical protein V5A42_01800 [Halofilum sp. (in: g-proteobacteria)]
MIRPVTGHEIGPGIVAAAGLAHQCHFLLDALPGLLRRRYGFRRHAVDALDIVVVRLDLQRAFKALAIGPLDHQPFGRFGVAPETDHEHAFR